MYAPPSSALALAPLQGTSPPSACRISVPHLRGHVHEVHQLRVARVAHVVGRDPGRVRPVLVADGELRMRRAVRRWHSRGDSTLPAGAGAFTSVCLCGRPPAPTPSFSAAPSSLSSSCYSFLTFRRRYSLGVELSALQDPQSSRTLNARRWLSCRVPQRRPVALRRVDRWPLVLLRYTAIHLRCILHLRYNTHTV